MELDLQRLTEESFELVDMATPDAAMWIQGRDQYGSICQRHRVTGVIKYPPFKAGLSVGVNPNAFQHIEFYPDSKFFAGLWEEYYDISSKETYWYNRRTDKSTWEDPQVAAKKPPPPPSSPPNKKKSEAHQWRKGDDGLWHNIETGDSQRDIPACRVKYPKLS